MTAPFASRRAAPCAVCEIGAVNAPPGQGSREEIRWRDQMSSLLSPHFSFAFDQLPQHVIEDSAVPVVAQLLGRIDPRDGLKALRRGTGGTRTDCEHRTRAHRLIEPLNVERLETGEPQ